jgi:DNA topoisomerase-1
MAFVAADYADVTGTFAVDDATEPSFAARLVALDGVRVATGRDFADTGALATQNVRHLSLADAQLVVDGLQAASFAVTSVDTKPYTRRPAAPFTTSTLQQEASRKLRLSSRATMRTAQTLYENGYITYMRTDSPVLSSQAIAAARRQAAELYGPEYVPDAPRVYKSKAKGAQEAHEAIRPAGDQFRTPAQVASQLSGEAFRLYELIWKRTVASQMADARGTTASVRLAGATGTAAAALAGQEATFGASGTVITFRGFLAAYEEGRDAARYSDTEDARLPQMAPGDPLTGTDLAAEGHRTSPPPRYTEASLVKALEERGIGRPSTYASTISTIVDRGYVNTRGQALVPSWLAFAVVRLLEENFDRLVDYGFTSTMEADLDEIAAGQRDRVTWLTQFYFGDGSGQGLRDLVANLGEIDARAISSIDIGDGLVVRVGRYGPYLEVPAEAGDEAVEDAKPRRVSVPEDLAPDELTPDKARELIAAEPEGDRVLGTDPTTGTTLVAKKGRYGPYVTELLPEPELDPSLSAAARKQALAALPKPRTASLFKDMDVATVTLDEALTLLSLPRVVGVDPTSGDPITAQNGRYGPYLKKGTDSRTLASEHQLLTITLAEALEVYAQPKRGRGATAAPPLRELGPDPESGKPMVVKDGRFGPYVTDGVTNRTLPRDMTPESVTPEQAAELLAAKRAAGPAKKRPVKRTTRTKATTKS